MANKPFFGQSPQELQNRQSDAVGVGQYLTGSRPAGDPNVVKNWNPFGMRNPDKALLQAGHQMNGPKEDLKKGQLKTQMQSYLKGLTDAGLTHDTAQKYLYDELTKRSGKGLPGAKGQQAQTLEHHALSNTWYGGQMGGQQVGGEVNKHLANDPSYQQATTRNYESGVIQPAAAATLQQFVGPGGLADQYAHYLANKGRKGNTNPLTALGITRSTLGIPVGQEITPRAIQQSALMQYYNDTGDASAFQSAGLPAPQNRDPYAKGTHLENLLTKAQAQASAQTRGGKLGTTTDQTLFDLLFNPQGAIGALQAAASPTANLKNKDTFAAAGLPGT